MQVKTKSFFSSSSIWGLILMAAPLIGELVGIEVTQEDIQTGTNVVDTAVKSVVGFFGFVLGIYGRWKAGRVVQPISVLPSSTVTVVVPDKVTK